MLKVWLKMKFAKAEDVLLDADRQRIVLGDHGRDQQGPELAIVGQRLVELALNGQPSRRRRICSRVAALISREASSSRGETVAWAVLAAEAYALNPCCILDEFRFVSDQLLCCLEGFVEIAA